MADVKGPLTTLNFALPSGLDATRLAQWRLRDGRTYAEIRADIAAALTGANQELLGQWGDLLHITTEDYLEYPTGGTLNDFVDISDLDELDAIHGETVGHMIDLRPKGRKIGGTWRFFRDLREGTLIATIRDHVQAGRNTVEKSVLNRALSNTANTLGSSGYDVPFANASATGPTYAPPAFAGQTFATTHNHYVGYDSGTYNLGTMLDAMALNVHEHGHAAPFTAYVAEADVSTYRALDNFVQPVDAQIFLVDQGGQTDLNRYFSRSALGDRPAAGGFRFGSFQSPYGIVELRSTSRIPTGYAFLYKSGGMNNAMNPLYVRVHPDQGFGFFINEIASDNRQYPVQQINVEIEYGVSCGMDRTKGAAGYLVAGGVWANPTIS